MPPSERTTTAVDERTAVRLLQLLGAMKRFVREQVPPLPTGGMSEEKFRTLLSLKLLGRSPLKRLAAYDGLSASAQCIMLDRLVDEGFADRASDPDDRRRVLYELSHDGLSMLDGEIRRRTAILTGRLGRLARGERSDFGRAVETLLSGLEKMRTSV